MSSPSEFDTAVKATLNGTATKPKRRDTPGGRFYEVEGETYPSVTHVLSVIAKPALVGWAANQERALAIETAADLYEDIHGTPKMARPTFITTFQGRLGKTKAHKKALEKAGEIGTQTHHLIEWNLRKALGWPVGPEPRVVDDAQWAFMAFQDFAGAVSLTPRLIEQTVFSRTHGYAGAMDLLATLDGQALEDYLRGHGGIPASVESVLHSTSHPLALIDFKTGKAVYAEALLQSVAYQQALIEMGHGAPEIGLIVRLPKVQTDPAFEVVLVPPVVELFPTFLHVLGLFRWWWVQEQASKRAWEAKQEKVNVQATQ